MCPLERGLSYFYSVFIWGVLLHTYIYIYTHCHCLSFHGHGHIRRSVKYCITSMLHHVLLYTEAEKY